VSFSHLALSVLSSFERLHPNSAPHACITKKVTAAWSDRSGTSAKPNQSFTSTNHTNNRYATCIFIGFVACIWTLQATFDPNYLAAPAQASHEARTRRQVDQNRQANKALELDWAGNAVYTKHRAAVPGAQAAGSNLAQTDEGVLPGSAAAVQAEFVGKKHYEDDIRFRSHASESRGAPMGSAAYQQGPGMPSADQWTSYVIICSAFRDFSRKHFCPWFAQNCKGDADRQAG